MTSSPHPLDSLVIGAGPAGIGTALALDAVDGLAHSIVERSAIGQTFLDWPREQTFLTPSFTGNGFGATDLNAVHHRTSPAFSLATDYPTGAQYAAYLRGVVKAFDLPVLRDTDVEDVTPAVDGSYEVSTSSGPIHARTVVWAGGEFSDPTPPRVAGGALAVHSSERDAWESRPGEVVVIGGYESGIDIACHHVERGSCVTVVDGEAPWDAGHGSDPSFNLAPRSRMRLKSALATGRLTLTEAHAARIKPDGDGFILLLSTGQRLSTPHRPIAATGFGSGLGPVSALFARRMDGWPELTKDDESTIAPGLFLAGPAMRHGGLKFCFVYKFRQRFAHVANVIGTRLGKDCSALEEWREQGMLTDDLSCCGVECAC
ncbi:NAD(P)/FAD-dependent oxidoreductase [Microbacterium amylolyticum]|uniref:Cation diffusion facilitator CzcD-associated flavoprotein CzcO n=1 Tax=Microbacterium amylolyticum TaxID=936337 RepID=A0ABS4ZG70_9MICO|nr:NAD(P)/FAD-dependent oxidoreductase [Microbacterium amylolyticum]MBP2436038.1 cation diffusion facilitator CzcD-associated flavoprotein CzcO [Microbacterium amylolyticum]